MLLNLNLSVILYVDKGMELSHFHRTFPMQSMLLFTIYSES